MTEKLEERGGIKYRYVKRRNLSKIRLKIKPTGVVEVSIPYCLKFEDAKNFAIANEGWIAARIDSYRPEVLGILRGGDRFIYFGKEYPIIKEEAKRYGIVLMGDSVTLKAPAGSERGDIERYIRRWFARKVKETAAAKMLEWEEVTGLKSTGLRVKYTTSQWGSCSARGVISVSGYIAEKPLECLDYLIVHELVHTKVKGHGKDFYALVGRYYPDWQRVRGILRNG